jgi:hypothetical protein
MRSFLRARVYAAVSVLVLMMSFVAVNAQPTFTSTPVTTATVGSPYTYAIFATDPSNNTLTFSAPTKPAWLTISTSGQSSATPFSTPIGGSTGAVVGDSAGNIYTTNVTNTTIYKITPDGTKSTWFTRQTGNVYSLGIYKGELYISYYTFGGTGSISCVRKLSLASPVSETTVYNSTSGAGGADVMTVVFKNDMMYVACYGTSKIVRVPLPGGSGTAGTEATVAQPWGMGFNSTGVLYIASPSSNLSTHVLGSATTTTVLTLPNLYDVKIDAYDNIYLGGYQFVKRYTPTLSSNVTVATPSGHALQMSIAPTGALLFSNYADGQIYKLQTGASLSGTPAIGDLGVNNVTVRSSNGTTTTDQTFTITVSAAPTISAMSNVTKTYGDATFAITNPTSNSAGAFSYVSSAPSVVSVSGNTVTVVGAGTATITATQAANGFFTSGTQTFTVTVNRLAPIVTSFPALTKTLSSGSYTITAPASTSAGTFTYTSSNASVATVSGNVVTLVGVGTSTITATQLATANYSAGTTTAVLTVVNNSLVNAGLPVTVNAAVGYSLRKLTNNYTGAAVNVRRSSDDAQADVAFAGNAVSEASVVTITAAGTSGLTVGSTMPFSTFYGSGSCYVTIWYDQSSNGRHATQTNTVFQPRLVNAGAIEKQNGKPAVVFPNGVNNWMSMFQFSSTAGYALNVVTASTNTNNTNGGRILSQGGSAPQSGGNSVNLRQVNTNWNFSATGFQYSSTSAVTNRTTVLTNANDGAGNSALFVNGVSEATATLAGSFLSAPYPMTLSSYANGTGEPYEGKVMEVIITLFPVITPTQRSSMEANQTAYYITPAITSFTPTTATIGTPVVISGTNLADATAVNFGGTAATSFIATAGTITATVGLGATGTITVTAPGGSATATGFTFVNVAARGLAFDGTGSYITLGSSSLLKPTAGVTVEAWVKRADWSVSTLNTIVGNTQSNGYSLIISGDSFSDAGTNISTLLRRNGSYAQVSWDASGLSAGWHHIAMTYDGRNTTLYVDGVQKNQNDAGANYPITYNAGNSTFIGAESSTADVPAAIPNYFNGSLDEVRIWSKALCAAQIANNISGEITAPQSGLVAYYKFNQGFVGANNTSVTTLTDLSGNNLTGTLRNFALTGSVSNWSDGTVTGNAPAFVAPTGTISGVASVCVNATTNLSTTLTGGTWNSSNATVAGINTSGVVTGLSAGTSLITYTTLCGSVASLTVTVNALPTPSIVVTGNLSFCTGQSTVLSVSNFGNALTFNNNYAQSTNAALPLGNAPRTIEAWIKCPSNATGVVANWGQVVTNQRSGLLISSGRIYFVGENNDQVGNILINDNAWHHVAITFDGGTVRLYVDGVLDVAVAKTLNTTGTTLRIGQRSVGDAGSELFVGTMDEVRIWNVARTQSQLQTARFNEIDANTAGLVAYYKFNQTTGTSIPDATVNNVTSTLTSSAGTWISSSNLASANTTYLWAPGNATTQSLTVTTSGTYTVTATNLQSCSATSTPVTITVNALPTVSTSKTDVICAGGNTGTITVTASGATAPYQYSKDGGVNYQTSNVFNNLTAGTYNIVVKPATGCASVSVPVVVGTAPDVTAPVANLASLPTVTGKCSATVATVPTATDNCSGIVNGTTTDALTYTAVGTYTITWKFTDAANNSSTQTQTVTVSRPEINITGNGVTIVKGDATPTAGDNTNFGSTIPNVPITKTFVVQNTGTSPLTLSTYTMSGANPSDFTVNGLESPITIAAGSSANVDVVFNSATVGTKNAIITFNNDDCDEASYDFAVTASITCVPPSFANTNVYIQHNTSTTTCDTAVTYALSVSGTTPTVTYTFTGATTGTGSGTGSGQLFNTGVTHVVVNAGNACGNVSTSFDVTIVDNVKPTPVVKNITVYLGANGQVTVTAAQLDNGSYDNCGPVTVSVNSTGYVCGVAAENGSIFLQAPNGALFNGVSFASYGTPGGSCGSFTIGNCNAGNSMSIVSGILVGNNSGTISASNNLFGDPCNGTVKSLAVQATYATTGATSNTFDCSKLGANNVTFVVSDVNGNAQSATAIVTVVDSTRPTVNTQNVTLCLDANGNASITPAMINNGSMDNCSIATVTLDKTTFNSTNVGANTVILSVTDVNGNVGTKTATVTINALPTQYAVTGGGAYCVGSANISVGLANSQSGVNYQLKNGASNVGSAVAGTGNALNFGIQAAAGTYTVSAINTTTSCASVMSGSATVVVNALPVITVTPAATTVCAGGTVTVTAAQNTTTTRTYNVPLADLLNVPNNCGNGAFYGSVNQGFRWTDLGSGTVTNVNIKFSTGVDCGGSHNSFLNGVAGTNFNSTVNCACGAPATPSIVTLNFGATGYVVGGTNTFSVGNVSTTFGYAPATLLSGFYAVVTVTYSSGGSGNISNWSWTPGGQTTSSITVAPTATTTYTVTAIDANGCTGTASSTITINPLPTQFNVTGGGIACGSGVPVGLDGSQNGVRYQLRNGASNVGAPVNGTGAAITFGNQASAGNYIVVATNISTTCTNVMFGNAVITIGTAPVFANTNSAVQSFTTSTTCNATVNYPLSASGSPGVNVSYVFTGVTTGSGAGTGNGSVFNKGVTNVAVTAGNGCGTLVYNFTVTVIDNVPPTITAPAAISVNNDAGKCGAAINLGTAVTADNCGVAGVTNNSASFTTEEGLFPVGVTTVTWTVTDNSGVTATATQVITVTDNEKPVIIAPTNISVNNDAANCGASVTITAPASADNCGVASTAGVRSDALALSAAYPVGTTTITWTVTDIHGNTQTATQTVTVTDNEKPFITLPINVVDFNDVAKCGATVPITAPASSDNCGVATTVGVRDDGLALTDDYPEGVTTITWTVTDIHGNTQTATQTVRIFDNERPVITAPVDVYVNNDAVKCGASVTITAPASTDNCGVASTVGVRSDALALTADYPVGNTTIIWTVTDIHGNAQIALQTITVADDEKPVITAPTNISVNNDASKCGAHVSIVAPASTDNCGVASTVGVRSDALALTADYPVGTTTITWTVTDIHGNTQTATQTVTVADNEKPVITAPTNISVNNDVSKCGANVAVAAPASTDNCAVASTAGVRSDALALTADYPVGTTTITWTVTDIHGNTQTATQTITVTDNQKPVIINLPANKTINALNLNCANLATWVKPTASDNCGIASIVSSDDFFEVAGYTLLPVGVNVITYTVTDIHGNVTTASFNITVVDNQPPIITGCPANITVNAANGRCDQVVNWNPPTASDNCPGVSLSTNHIQGETFPLGTTTVIYTATDHVGLQTVCSFTVTVVDAQKPVLAGVPANVTVECNAVPNAATVTATDNCATTVAVVYNEARTNGNCASNYILTRTWTATDAAGNIASGTQVITVQDTQAPVLSAAPANVTVECNAVPVAATLTATDNCDAPHVTYNESRTNGNCPSNYILTRTWTATDACGNTSSKTQVITVQDTQAPVLSAAPANVTVECDAVPTAATLTATDNCDTPTVTYNETRTNGNSPSNYTLTRTWTATDACGNTSSKTQVITVRDTKAPVLTAAPVNVTVECDAVPTAATLTATDNCDATPVVTYNEVRTNGNCPSNYILTRTWTATDASGNTSGKTQVITVQDTKAPVLSAAPANVTVECDAVPAAATLTATDNCDAPAVVYNETRTNGNSPSNYTLTRTWTATDACGNASSKTQIITVQDTQAPVISIAPADVTVECNAVPAAATLTATDNCDATPVVTYTEVRTNGNCPSNYILTRTWTAVDASGNTSSKTQTITVQDTQAPVLSAAPVNVTVECDAVPVAATLTATDNCDEPTVTYAEVRTNGNSPSNYTLTRTWNAVDACGNTSSKTQVITVQDTHAPVISIAPADVTVECDAVPAAATLTATDNCDATPVVTYVEVRTNGNCPSNYILTRTWTAVDASGNTSSKTQTVTVQDTQAPVLSAAPANVTVECDAVPTAATLTATDNCDAPTVTYAEVRTNGNSPSNYTLTRTWTAVDACGNTSGKTQVITVQDTQAPVITAAPANVTVECNAVPTAAVLTATDNCDAPVVTYAEVRTNGNCPSNYILTRTWTSTDASGNTSSKTQVITVQDTQAPVLSAAPADVTVECDAVPVAATLTATDNCDAPVVTYVEVRTNGNCPSNYILTRTWTAVDACGNASSKTQVITVQDTQAPVLSAAPVNVTVECDAVPTAATLSATDNCDTPTVTYNEARTNGNSPSNYTLTRTWTATDACGNASSKTQVITVRDTKKPVLSTAPVNVTVECNAVPAAATLTATDNCDATPVVTYNESRTNGNCPSNYTLTRTWTATDASGNACSKTQTITVQDTQKPILSAAPANVTVACNAVPAAATLTATDNCDAPTVTYAEVRTNGSSPFNYTLTRTWTATDACGNSCSKTQVITVRDTQAPVPVIALLPTLTGDCSVTATAPTAQDNCAGIITATTVNPVSYTAQGVYTITWSYNDNNGNTSTQTQRVVVKDQSGPIANVATLPTVTGQCSAIVTTKPTATDACSGVTAPATTTDPLTYNTQGAYTIHWTYTDNLGNKTYQDQSVIVKDNMAPVPNVASLPTIEGQCSVNITMVTSTRCTDNCHCCRNVCHCRTSDCHCNQWGEWLSNILSYFFGNTGDGNNDCDHDDEAEDVNNLKMQAPTATDNCKGTITGTTTDPLNYSMQGTYTIHWTFTDGNGNTSVQNQTVTVADVEAPVPNANNLPTVYGTCSATVTSKPTAKDNCKGTLTGTTTDPLTYTGNGTYVIHWTFSDGNGNTSTQNQTVVINDNIKPALSEPNDITISCSASTLPSTTGNATATDNCGTPVITYNDVISGNRITRTWKATDAAGNYTTDVQVITISDNTKPVITAPSDLTVNCGTSTLPAATGTAAATDNCSTATVTYSDHTSGNVITRTWKATDAAGNNSTDVQTITIVDLVKPTITAPNNVNVNCGSSTNPSATGTATGADNCSTATVTYSDATSGNVITRTWKATDASGNFITATQTITVVDNTKPVISDASDITISCSASTLPASCGGIPNASDNCSAVVVTYSDVTAGNKITRTWKATDAAGNFATSIQVITIVDNTKPVLTEPNDITINCGASTLPAVTGNATATDNCSTPTVTYTDATSGNVITRTWKATDASGNYVTDVQYITMGSAFTAGLTSVPTNSTYTGGVNTNLYLGFGAQSTTLQMCNLPSAGAPYTYAWSGSASNKLNSTTTASPVFTPTMFGYYTFAVTVTNKYGCTSFANISICVTDIRVPGTNGAKVYVCHTPNGKNAVAQTLQVAISQVSSHIGSGSCGSNGNDRLGSCDQSPCNTPVTNSIVGNTSKATGESSEEVVTTDEDLKVTVMPNPTTTFFTLKLESKYETPLNMRVMDARGRVIDAKSKIGANSTIQIGHNYSSGTYYAEIIQGTKRKVVQMIKGRG